MMYLMCQNDMEQIDIQTINSSMAELHYKNNDFKMDSCSPHAGITVRI